MVAFRVDEPYLVGGDFMVDAVSFWCGDSRFLRIRENKNDRLCRKPSIGKGILRCLSSVGSVHDRFTESGGEVFRAGRAEIRTFSVADGECPSLDFPVTDH